MTRHRIFACVLVTLAAAAIGCGDDGGAAPRMDPADGFACGAATCSTGSLCCLDCAGNGACFAGVSRCPALMCEMPMVDGGSSGGTDAGMSAPVPDGGGPGPAADAGTSTPPPPALCGDRMCGATEECCVFGEGGSGGFGGDEPGGVAGSETCVPAGSCERAGGTPRDPSDPTDPMEPGDPGEPPPDLRRCVVAEDGSSTCLAGEVCCAGVFDREGVCLPEAECPVPGGGRG